MGRAAGAQRGGAREARPGPQHRATMLRWSLAAAALSVCVNGQCAENCRTCKSVSSTDCEVCSDGYVLIDEDLDGVGACESPLRAATE